MTINEPERRAAQGPMVQLVRLILNCTIHMKGRFGSFECIFHRHDFFAFRSCHDMNSMGKKLIKCMMCRKAFHNIVCCGGGGGAGFKLKQPSMVSDNQQNGKYTRRKVGGSERSSIGPPGPMQQRRKSS